MVTDLAAPPAAVHQRRFTVVWQGPDRRFVPIAELEVGRVDDGGFVTCFRYLPSASTAPGFAPLLAFPDLDEVYRSEGGLPPFLTNRVMSPRRPDFGHHLASLGLSLEEADPLEILARSGGSRATDTLQLVPSLERDGDVLWRHVVVSGVRHRPGVEEILASLDEGDELLLRPEPDNPRNADAMLLETSDGRAVGWYPDHLLPELHAHQERGGDAKVTVVVINGPDVPWHLRLLCRLELRDGAGTGAA